MNFKTNYERVSRIIIIIFIYSVIISPVFLYSGQVKKIVDSYVFPQEAKSILGDYLPYFQYTLIVFSALLVLGILILIANRYFFSQTSFKNTVIKLKSTEIKATFEEYLYYGGRLEGSILPGLMSKNKIKKALSALYAIISVLPSLEGNYLITAILVSLPFIVFLLTGVLRKERRRVDPALKIIFLLCFSAIFSASCFFTVTNYQNHTFRSSFASGVLSKTPDFLEGIHIKIDHEMFYDLAIRMDDGNSLPYLKKGLLMEEKGDMSQAENNYLKAIMNKADNYEAYYRLGKIYETGDNNAKALDMLEKAQSSNPDFAPAFYDAAKLLIEQGDIDKAAKLSKQAARIDQNDIEVYRLNAMIMMTQKNYEEVIGSYNKAIGINPKLPDLYTEKAMVLYDLSRYDEALYNVNRALALKHEKDNIVLKYLILLGQQKSKEAAECLKGTDVKIVDASLRGEQMEEALEKGDMITAGKALAGDPGVRLSDADKHEQNAKTLFNNKNFDGALGEIDAAIQIDPGRIDYYSLKCEILLEKGDLDKIGVQLASESSLKQSYASYLVQGRYYLVKGDNKSAIKAFEDATGINPYRSEAYAGKAAALSNQNEDSVASDYMYMAMKITSGDYFNYYAQSVIYLNDKHYEEALVSINKAIELHGASAELNLQKTKVNNALGTVATKPAAPAK